MMEKPEIVLIDMDTWARRTHYDVYSKRAKCSSHLTCTLDVTALYFNCKKSNIRFYPAMIVLVSELINKMPEFRMTFDAEHRLGYWNFLSPSYTIFHEDDNTFSGINTVWVDSREDFYHALIADMLKYRNEKGISVGPELCNIFHISCLPWLNFDSFELHLSNDFYLAPVITWGKYSKEKEKIRMPVSITINHAAADGYHISQFLIQLQELCNGSIY
ncbi:MAG: CatA-like O-acetyltransferase [Victivallaceae bacterium]|nr:CatA-like O-acetyltransferase [Victivallaceae bacterium]